MVSGRIYCLCAVAVLVKDFVHENHKLRQGALPGQIFAETIGIRYFMYQIYKAFAHFRIEMKFMRDSIVPVCKTAAQIRICGGEGLQIIRVNGKDNSFMDTRIYL